MAKSPLSQALSNKSASAKQTIMISVADPNSTNIAKLTKSIGTGAAAGAESPLLKSIMNVLNGDAQDSIERLAFERDPTVTNEFQALFYTKTRLLPDSVLKRIAIQDDLVAAIVGVRSNQIAAFGRPQPDRFSTGFKIEPKPGVLNDKEKNYKDEIQSRIEKARDCLSMCGRVAGWADADRMTLSQFLYQQTRNAVIVGRFATEIIHVTEDGEKKFHSFRPIDAGTIYKATPQTKAAEQVRKQARLLLEQLKNEKFIPDKMEHGEYAHVQVIEGRPVQAFTPDECVVHNVYPVTDVELCGYPLTPIDTMIAAVTTHINIVTHNKLYFQAGRAARGMLIIKSEDVSPAIVATIRQQFNASINSVNNAWRMPVFGIGPQDEITWAPIDNSSRDMEFQYLSDSNARVILSAFQMSPEELPGYAHLSRGTNNQALSECFQEDSILWTDNGAVSAKDLLGNIKNEVPVRVWTGTEYTAARLFRTGDKILCETRAGNLTLKTSPDHRFRVLTDEGDLAWKRQEKLRVGDLLVVNAKPVPGDASKIPMFRGKVFTPAMMEVLGWSIGDGTLIEPVANVHGGGLKLFYHHDKERDIWESHAKTLTDFGFDVKQHERVVTEEEATKLKSEYGFKTVAKTRITNTIYSNEFCAFLKEIGFSFSSRDKSIPAVFHVLPIEYRKAFLKGLFSADGHATKQGAIVLTMQADSTREQVGQMLLGLGIRTLACNGIVRCSFGDKELEKQLYVKDKNLFWEQIGFIQSHKLARRRDQKWSLGAAPTTLAARLLGPLIETTLFKSWGKRTRDNIKGIIQGKRTVSFNKLQEFLSEIGQVPAWMCDYHVEPVTELVAHGSVVPMVDVEVFDKEHAQILQGFQVHNSNNEYKLEAHRDVGIRPLISQFQDFLNSRIFPLIDENLAKLCVIKLVGLDAETAEKESVRLQQDMVIHMTYDEVRERVEKDPLGEEWAGDLPLNPTIWEYINSLFTVGEILEKFCGREGASKDPSLAYRRDQYWFSQVNNLMQQQQMQAQAQQAQAQAAQGGQPSQGPDGKGQPPEGGAPPQGGQGQAQPPQQEESDLTRGLDQLMGLLTKTEKQLTPSKRRVLAQQRKTVKSTMDKWHEERDATLKSFMDTVEHFVPKS